jgi:hypothetical protein
MFAKMKFKKVRKAPAQHNIGLSYLEDRDTVSYNVLQTKKKPIYQEAY